MGYDPLQQGLVALTCWDDLADSADEWIGERRYDFSRSLAALVHDALGAGLRSEEIRAKALQAAETQSTMLVDDVEHVQTVSECKVALLQEVARVFPRGLRRPTAPDDRLQLRPWQENDAADYQAIMTNPAVWTHLPDNGELEQLSTSDPGSIIAAVNEGTNHRVYAIEVDGRPAGQVRVLFHAQSGGIRAGEVIYMLSDQYWGRGIMSQALPAFVERCFDEFSLDVLVAWIHPDNEGSIRCAERSGFFRNESDYESDLAAATNHSGFHQYLCYRLDFADAAKERLSEPLPLAQAS